MDNQQLELLRSKCQNNFYKFCQVMMREDGYDMAKFQEFICGEVQDSLDHSREPRLCFSVPPGYGKSTLISKLLPAFLLGQNPKNKIILITYGATLSDDLGKDCRALMGRDIYKTIFPNSVIEGDGKTGSFSTTSGGGLRAVGRGGSIIGFRANFILCDDIIKDTEEAGSDKIINKIHDWFPTVPMTRLLPGAGVIILSTRWTKKDLIGLVTRTSNKWKYFNIECICDNPETDLIGRELGENLWDFYSLESRLEIRRTNPKMFETVYQGKPVSDSNRCIFLDDITYTDDLYFDKDTDLTILSYDTASKVTKTSDYNAICVFRLNKSMTKAILIRLYRKKMEFPQLLKTYNELDDTFKPNLTIIEDKNSGIQLIQLNKKEWVFASKCFKSMDDKIRWAEVLNLKMSEGIVKFNSSLLRNEEALTELSEYPYSVHDDFALSAIHFLKWFLSSDKETFSRTEIEIDTTSRKDFLERVSKNSKKLSYIRTRRPSNKTFFR